LVNEQGLVVSPPVSRRHDAIQFGIAFSYVRQFGIAFSYVRPTCFCRFNSDLVDATVQPPSIHPFHGNRHTSTNKWWHFAHA